MTSRVTVVGSGPAGFEVTATLLAEFSDVVINLVDRAALPDGHLRHGPAAGAARLEHAARSVDAVLGDSRVSFHGSVDVGSAVSLDDLLSAAHAVVLTTGAPLDMPLVIAGRDSVGVGTLTHVEAWLAGSADVGLDELDLAMDTAVVLGSSPPALRAAEALCGRTPDSASVPARDRLAASKLRHVQVVDPRSRSELALPEHLPQNLVVRDTLTPVGVVGRNRARAVRCVHRPDTYGRVVTEDLRAQLLLRPRGDEFPWPELDERDGLVARIGARVLREGVPVRGLYVSGWAGRGPREDGSHAVDAALVAAALRADRPDLPEPTAGLDFPGITGLSGWSAVAATDELLKRFAGEGKSPIADYHGLMEQVDED